MLSRLLIFHLRIAKMGLGFFMKRRLGLIPTVALGFALAHSIQAETPSQTDPTALALVSKGDNYVGIQSKDKLVEIVSDKSIGSLQPNIWHVIYYDPDAPMKCVEVKFGAGQEMDVSHPLRPFQLPRKGDEVFDKGKLKVDSDQALNIAGDQPLVKPLTLKATKLTLTHGDFLPVWKVELWAAKQSDPNHLAGVGYVTISATDGTIVRTDLHPGSAE
jgi:hypothetical protein